MAIIKSEYGVKTFLKRAVWRFKLFGRIPFAIGFSFDWTLLYKPLYCIPAIILGLFDYEWFGFGWSVWGIFAAEADQGFQQRWNFGSYFGLMDFGFVAILSLGIVMIFRYLGG